MGGLLKYLFGPGRANEHSHQRIVAASDPSWTGTAQPDTSTLAQLVAEMDEPVTAHGDRTRAGYVYHLVVSVPAHDGPLDDAAWQQVAQRFAEKLGFDDQVHWIAINHGRSTNGNDHVHLVANLIRDDGRVHRLAYDRMRQREVCAELENELALTATAPAGLGDGRSLSRQEVEQLRSGVVADAADLAPRRLATIVRAVAAGARSEPEFVERLRGEGLVVRARQERGNAAVVTGYSVARRGGQGPLVWYGGGRLGRDLRLPALRIRWGQSDAQRRAAATAWFSDAALRRRAAPGSLVAAAEALRQAGDRLQKVPPEDRFCWYVAAQESAGVLAAAAGATSDDQLRRELTTAWQAISRSTPPGTRPSVDAGFASTLTASDTQQRVPDAPDTVPVISPPGRLSQAHADHAGQVSTLLAGASRVLMAARLADAPAHARVHALVVQAVELAAQIMRTIAAQDGGTAAERRAAEATARAQLAAAAASCPRNGWQFAKTGSEVLETVRGGPAHATACVPAVPVGVQRGAESNDVAR